MQSARIDYLTNEVMTATPERLQLMLVEGALRLSHQARASWHAGNDEAAYEALSRAQLVVGEMIGGLDARAHKELVQRITAVYLFIYRALVDATFNRDDARLAEAVRVLEVERETWRKLVGGAPKPVLSFSGEHDQQPVLGQSFMA